jgi:hypothetical protein
MAKGTDDHDEVCDFGREGMDETEFDEKLRGRRHSCKNRIQKILTT